MKKVKESNEKIYKKLNKRSKLLLAGKIVTAVFAAAIVLGGVMYAKYYAESYQKGIAIASGIYFTSNYAVETNEDEYYESLVLTEFTGNGYKFEIVLDIIKVNSDVNIGDE